MQGLFIPEITAEMFMNGCLESIEALMAEGELYDIDYNPKQPEPCEDAVSRKDVLDAIMSEPTEAHYPSWYADKVKALLSVRPEQRWIPSSERRPEFPCIAYDGKNPPFVPVDLVTFGDDVVSGHIFEILRESPLAIGLKSKDFEKKYKAILATAHCNRIIAWMPLPKPYKEGEV